MPVCPHYCWEAGGKGTFTLQLWCCLGLFCECTWAHCLLWRAKLAGRVHEAEKILCYVGYVGPVTKHSFLNHCISHISHMPLKRSICNAPAFSGPSRHQHLLFVFELWCLWPLWKYGTWTLTQPLLLRASLTQREPRVCVCSLLVCVTLALGYGQRYWIHPWAVSPCDFTFNLLHFSPQVITQFVLMTTVAQTLRPSP